MKDEIINIIREILYLEEGSVSETTILEDIFKNSMDVIELVAVLGSKYNLSIDPQAMNSIKTVGDIVEFVSQNSSEEPVIDDKKF